MKFKSSLWLLLILILGACTHNSNRQFTEEDVIEIYYSIEFAKPAVAQATLEKYGMRNDTKRRQYYSTIRELTDTPEKYDLFLAKVEEYKQNQFAQEKKEL